MTAIHREVMYRFDCGYDINFHPAISVHNQDKRLIWELIKNHQKENAFIDLNQILSTYSLRKYDCGDLSGEFWGGSGGLKLYK